MAKWKRCRSRITCTGSGQSTSASNHISMCSSCNPPSHNSASSRVRATRLRSRTCHAAPGRTGTCRSRHWVSSGRLVQHSAEYATQSEQQGQSIEVAEDLKRAAMRTLFTRGLRGEAQRETEIGPMPESWGQTTLGDLCGGSGGAIQTGPFGSQLHKDDYQNTGVPVVNPTHLSAGRIDHENVPRISDENAHRLERHRLYVDDIVLARRGQIGRMARVTESEEGWLCGTGSFLVRVRQPFVDNRFLHFQLTTQSIARWLTAHAAGAIMPNLNNVVLRQIPVFFTTHCRTERNCRHPREHRPQD